MFDAPDLESEVRDMPRRIAVLDNVFFTHVRDGGLSEEGHNLVATLLVDLEHAAARLTTALDADFARRAEAYRRASPAPSKSPEAVSSAIDIECAVFDVEGAALLLSLAVEDVFGTDRKNADPDGRYTYRLNSDQVMALQHAESGVRKAMNDLRASFYGPDAVASL